MLAVKETARHVNDTQQFLVIPLCFCLRAVGRSIHPLHELLCLPGFTDKKHAVEL